MKKKGRKTKMILRKSHKMAKLTPIPLINI